MTWGQIDDTYGYTGYVGNTVLADAVPSTTSGTWSGWADAAIAPGSSFEFNLQSSPATDFPIVITVGADDGSGTLEVTVAATDTQAPTVTPQPTDIPPTLSPTTDAEKCGDSDGYAEGTCCASLTVGGVSYLKMAGECCYGGCAYQNADGSADYIYSYYSTWYGNPFYPCAIEYYTHGPYYQPAVEQMCDDYGVPTPEPFPAPTAKPTESGPQPTVPPPDPTAEPSPKPTSVPSLKPTDPAPTVSPTTETGAPAPVPTDSAKPTQTWGPTSAPTFVPTPGCKNSQWLYYGEKGPDYDSWAAAEVTAFITSGSLEGGNPGTVFDLPTGTGGRQYFCAFKSELCVSLVFDFGSKANAPDSSAYITLGSTKTECDTDAAEDSDACDAGDTFTQYFDGGDEDQTVFTFNFCMKKGEFYFAPSPRPTMFTPPTPEPQAQGVIDVECEDSDSWYFKKAKWGCDWVAKKPESRCARGDSDDVLATEACPGTCGDACSSACPDDSTSWFLDGNSNKDCAWVAGSTRRRCNKEDYYGVSAMEACPQTCDEECFEPSAQPAPLPTTYFRPSAAPTEHRACADSTSWFYKGKTKNGCDWIADSPGSRCKDKYQDKDGESSIEACAGTCSDDCAPTAAPTTNRPTVTFSCEDSTSWWYRKSKYDCSYVAANPESRCNSKNVDNSGVDVTLGCPMTCNERCEPTPHPTYSQVPTAAPTVGPTCFDDENWYYKKKKYDCEYVAKKTTRCDDDNSYNGVSAWEACKETCGRCLPTEAPTEGSTCVDSDSWYYKKVKYDCQYVAKKTSRCHDDNEQDGVTALEACPFTCDRCLPTDAPSAYPTELPTDSFPPTELFVCEDSNSWYSKKEKNNCDWVAAKTKSRCKDKYTDEADVPSTEACPEACGQC
mmetsp:Transcript_27958/g.83784  ORF Transcript_27958/g.83784 Transcript_27958/m.83784 type:complete len:891 (+) Transcript_27958:289-2961(+)